MQLAVPAALSASTGETDPIRYYNRPGIGRVFRRRIEMGLDQIPPMPEDCSALEVGYGAGVVLFNLASRVKRLYGLDLDADPEAVAARLAGLGVQAELTRGSVLNMKPYYSDAQFQLVACFSVMEHLHQPSDALAEIHRVLSPGGTLILGMPAVNRFMEYAFRAIGFKDIDDYHVTTPASVWTLVEHSPDWTAARGSLPGSVPFAAALYHVFRLTKR